MRIEGYEVDPSNATVLGIALFEHVKGLGFLFPPPKKKLEMHHEAPEFKFAKHFFH